jgi:hypothetical protein
MIIPAIKGYKNFIKPFFKIGDILRKQNKINGKIKHE